VSSGYSDTLPRNPAPTDADCEAVAAIATPALDAATRRFTRWNSLLDLVIDQGGIATWRPSLETCRSDEARALADGYDAAQAARGDSRRAYRSTCGRCGRCAPTPTVKRRRSRQVALLPVTA